MHKGRHHNNEKKLIKVLPVVLIDYGILRTSIGKKVYGDL